MKKADTWMPLYIGDYLADTSRLTTEQHGAYLLLLMDYWRNGAPPDEENVLASITKLSVPQWRRNAAILRGFFVVEDGLWHQERADAERAKAGGVSSKRSEAGKAGAAKRWSDSDGNADDKPEAEPVAKQMANAMANASQNDAPSPSHSHSHSQSQKTPKPPDPPPGVERRFTEFWQAYPRKVGKDAAARAFARRKPDDTLLSAMLAAIALQRQSPDWRKDAGQFIPHPTTWLNEGRWQDEQGVAANAGDMWASAK